MRSSVAWNESLVAVATERSIGSAASDSSRERGVRGGSTMSEGCPRAAVASSRRTGVLGLDVAMVPLARTGFPARWTGCRSTPARRWAVPAFREPRTRSRGRSWPAQNAASAIRVDTLEHQVDTASADGRQTLHECRHPGLEHLVGDLRYASTAFARRQREVADELGEQTVNGRVDVLDGHIQPTENGKPIRLQLEESRPDGPVGRVFPLHAAPLPQTTQRTLVRACKRVRRGPPQTPSLAR